MKYKQDRVDDTSISEAALHACADACRLKRRPELTDDERGLVDKAVDLLMAVSNSTEARVPLPTYRELESAVAKETGA